MPIERCSFASNLQHCKVNKKRIQRFTSAQLNLLYNLKRRIFAKSV